MLIFSINAISHKFHLKAFAKVLNLLCRKGSTLNFEAFTKVLKYYLVLDIRQLKLAFTENQISAFTLV